MEPRPCSVCKWHRRSACLPGCMFRNIFPLRDEDFKKMMQIWDCNKLERVIMSVEENQRSELVNSLRYEARLRSANNIQGCLGYVRSLEEENLILRTALSYFYLTAPAVQQALNLRPMHHQSVHLHSSMPAQQTASTYGQSPANVRPTTQRVQPPRAPDFRSISVPGAVFQSDWSQPGPNVPNIRPTIADFSSGVAFHVPGAAIHPDLTHLSQPGPSAPNIRPTTQCEFQPELNDPPPSYGQFAPHMSSVQQAPTSTDLRPGPIPDAFLHQELSQPGTGQVQAANSGDSSLVPGSGLIDYGFEWNIEEIGSAGGDPGCI